MSAGIIPDMYRHTARKSTVSKSLKSSNATSCQNSSLSYRTSHVDDKHSIVLPSTKFDQIQQEIKVEQDPFVFLPDNETEQMKIEDDIDQIVYEIFDDIAKQIGSLTSVKHRPHIQQVSQLINKNDRTHCYLSRLA
jgi:hypothetical protein